MGRQLADPLPQKKVKYNFFLGNVMLEEATNNDWDDMRSNKQI
jgi:hypothetical protein